MYPPHSCWLLLLHGASLAVQYWGKIFVEPWVWRNTLVSLKREKAVKGKNRNVSAGLYLKDVPGRGAMTAVWRKSRFSFRQARTQKKCDSLYQLLLGARRAGAVPWLHPCCLGSILQGRMSLGSCCCWAPPKRASWCRSQALPLFCMGWALHRESIIPR